jgi:hypothetical protein
MVWRKNKQGSIHPDTNRLRNRLIGLDRKHCAVLSHGRHSCRTEASREPDQKESFLTRIDRSYSQPLGRSDFPTIANQCKYYIRRGARDGAGNITSFTSSGWEDIVLCRLRLPLRLEDQCTKERGKEATRPAIKGQAFKSTMRNTADRHRRYWQLMASVETRHGGEQANKLCSTMQRDSHCRKRRCVPVETKF